MSLKTMLSYGLRLTLTAALLAVLLNQVDLASVAEVFGAANLGWLALGVGVYLLSIVCSAWRWQVLLHAMGFRFRLLPILRLVLSGAFFNMFLPSSVGGDVMKMVLIAPELEQREAAVSSVLMDRVVGLAVTIVVGLLAVLLLPSIWSNTAMLISLGLALLVFSAGSFALFSRPLLDLVARLTPGAIWRRVGPHVLRVHGSLMLAARQPAALARAAAISGLRQVAICLSVFCAGQGFGLGLGPLVYFATVPIAVAITALPIAINGLGLQDNALLLLLGGFGLAGAQILGLSIYLHTVRVGIGLLGGVVFAFTRGSREAVAQTGAEVPRLGD